MSNTITAGTFKSSAISSVAAPPKHRHSPYGYVPTEWVCIVFILLYGLSAAVHTAQTFRSRLWWLLPTTCLAGVGEVIGWAARLWSSRNPLLMDPYLMQITATIIAPTPLIAANFVVLGQIIRRIGQDYSRLNAHWYTIVFCVCDIIALVIQAVGGANASIAVNNGRDPAPGGRIMLAGVSFQMAALVFFVILSAEFLLLYVHDRPFKRNNGPVQPGYMTRKTKVMIIGLALEAVFLFIFIRSIYRVVELADDWTGKIITTQSFLNVFDGAMILLAMFTFNFFHPGYMLGHARTWLNGKGSPVNVKQQMVESSTKDGQSQDSVA